MPDAATEQLCTKCKTKPRADSDSSNPWCLECRAEYAREYRSVKKEMRESRGYAAGCSAKTDQIARQLESRPDTMISSWATARWVREMPMPD